MKPRRQGRLAARDGQGEDFSGNFTGVGAGAAVGGGGGAVILQNQNGVKVELLSTTQGVKLAIAAAGVNMKIKE